MLTWEHLEGGVDVLPSTSVRLGPTGWAVRGGSYRSSSAVVRKVGNCDQFAFECIVVLAKESAEEAERFNQIKNRTTIIELDISKM